MRLRPKKTACGIFAGCARKRGGHARDAGRPRPLCSCRFARSNIQCTRCSCQQALTAHAVMYRSHVGLRKWFLAAYLVASDKRGISACRLARELKVKWVCAYYLLQRIRTAQAESGCLQRS